MKDKIVKKQSRWVEEAEQLITQTCIGVATTQVQKNFESFFPDIEEESHSLYVEVYHDTIGLLEEISNGARIVKAKEIESMFTHSLHFASKYMESGGNFKNLFTELSSAFFNNVDFHENTLRNIVDTKVTEIKPQLKEVFANIFDSMVDECTTKAASTDKSLVIDIAFKHTAFYCYINQLLDKYFGEKLEALQKYTISSLYTPFEESHVESKTQYAMKPVCEALKTSGALFVKEEKLQISHSISSYSKEMEDNSQHYISKSHNLSKTEIQPKLKATHSSAYEYKSEEDREEVSLIHSSHIGYSNKQIEPKNTEFFDDKKSNASGISYKSNVSMQSIKMMKELIKPGMSADELLKMMEDINLKHEGTGESSIIKNSENEGHDINLLGKDTPGEID